MFVFYDSYLTDNNTSKLQTGSLISFSRSLSRSGGAKKN